MFSQNYPELPDNLTLTILSNNQYTGATVMSQIARIEFTKGASKK